MIITPPYYKVFILNTGKSLKLGTKLVFVSSECTGHVRVQQEGVRGPPAPEVQMPSNLAITNKSL